MNIKQKFEDLKTKARENRPQIIAAVSTGVTVVLAVMLVDAARRIDEANETVESSNKVLEDTLKHFKTPIRLAITDCGIDDLKNGESVIWDHCGHTIDLAFDPDVVCDVHPKDAKPINVSDV